jgi:hypothetical protein
MSAFAAAVEAGVPLLTSYRRHFRGLGAVRCAALRHASGRAGDNRRMVAGSQSEALCRNDNTCDADFSPDGAAEAGVMPVRQPNATSDDSASPHVSANSITEEFLTSGI